MSDVHRKAIWLVAASSHTLQQAVNDFARFHFDRPRRVRDLRADGTFCLVGGVSSYQCQIVGPCYEISALPERRETQAPASSVHGTHGPA